MEYRENSLKLQIWDSAGQERYKALIPSYVRGSSIIFIIYDISNKNTFTNVITWINFIKQVHNEDSFLVLCGNKIDLPRQVSTNEGKNLAQKENMIFFETSAKSGDGVNIMMYTCIAKLPFFEQFKIEDKEKLVKELCDNNSSKNNEGKVYGVDIDKQYEFTSEDNTSNIVLKKDVDIDDNKKKCAC